jgi:hypothetical protein
LKAASGLVVIHDIGGQKLHQNGATRPVFGAKTAPKSMTLVTQKTVWLNQGPQRLARKMELVFHSCKAVEFAVQNTPSGTPIIGRCSPPEAWE